MKINSKIKISLTTLVVGAVFLSATGTHALTPKPHQKPSGEVRIGGRGLATSSATVTASTTPRQGPKRGKAVEKMANAALNVAENISRRIERLDTIATKLDTKIARFTASTTLSASSTIMLNDAKVSLALAKTDLVQAKADILIVITTAENASGTTLNRDTIQKIRTSLKSIERKVISSHKALTKTANLLRKIEKELRPRKDHKDGDSNASSTNRDLQIIEE